VFETMPIQLRSPSPFFANNTVARGFLESEEPDFKSMATQRLCSRLAHPDSKGGPLIRGLLRMGGEDEAHPATTFAPSSSPT
jgi:hypothetical protein